LPQRDSAGSVCEQLRRTVLCDKNMKPITIDSRRLFHWERKKILEIVPSLDMGARVEYVQGGPDRERPQAELSLCARGGGRKPPHQAQPDGIFQDSAKGVLVVPGTKCSVLPFVHVKRWFTLGQKRSVADGIKIMLPVVHNYPN